MKTPLILALSLAFAFTIQAEEPAYKEGKPFTEATFTKIMGDVKIASPDKKEESTAKVMSVITGEQLVKTSAGARAELEFPDKTICRVGANTVVSFAKDKRLVQIKGGEILFSIPKGLGDTSVQTPALTAAVYGTTFYISLDPNMKIYACLEGVCKVGPHLLTAGEKISVPQGKKAPDVKKENFNIANFIKVNHLSTEFDTPLPGKTLIEEEVAKQAKKS